MLKNKKKNKQIAEEVWKGKAAWKDAELIGQREGNFWERDAEWLCRVKERR